jgi:hypothetical protein
LKTPPAPAGYSGKPLVEKLGVPAGARIVILDAPADYARTLGKLPPGTTTASRLYAGAPFVQAFVTSRKRLEALLPKILGALGEGGMLWVSWPKKSSGVETDLTEDVLREVALPLGIVDVKVAAVDGTWSGLKFYRRRPQQAARN